MKQLSVISLLLLLLVSTAGYYMLFCVDLAAVRHGVKEIIKDDKDVDAISLTFTLVNGKPAAQGLSFTDEDEFMYQGRMYDVISEVRTNGRVTYRCFSDTKETELADDLSRKIETDRDQSSQSHKGRLSLKDYLKDFTSHVASCYRIGTDVSVCKFYCDNSTQSKQNALRIVLSPPPEFIS